MTKKSYPIVGMHCASCEKLLEDEFRNISGVEKVEADRKNNSVKIFYSAEVPEFSEIKSVAEKFGYQAFENEEDIIPENPYTSISWPDKST